MMSPTIRSPLIRMISKSQDAERGVIEVNRLGRFGKDFSQDALAVDEEKLLLFWRLGRQMLEWN